jgi:hypothetical protein
MESKLNCGSNGYPLKEGFERCSMMYLHYHKLSSFEGRSALDCTENCRREVLSRMIHRGKRNCSKIQEIMEEAELMCYARCNWCSLSNDFSVLFEVRNASLEWIEEMLNLCIVKYEELIDATRKGVKCLEETIFELIGGMLI